MSSTQDDGVDFVVGALKARSATDPASGPASGPVSMPIEVWHQARVVDAGEAYFDRSVEPIP